MRVTFRCDGRVLEYTPGRIYETELTTHLERLLRDGSNLVLIDPPSVDALSTVKAVRQEVLTTMPNQTVSNNSNIAKTPSAAASVLSHADTSSKAPKPNSGISGPQTQN